MQHVSRPFQLLGTDKYFMQLFACYYTAWLFDCVRAGGWTDKRGGEKFLYPHHVSTLQKHTDLQQLNTNEEFEAEV